MGMLSSGRILFAAREFLHWYLCTRRENVCLHILTGYAYFFTETFKAENWSMEVHWRMDFNMCTVVQDSDTTLSKDKLIALDETCHGSSQLTELTDWR